MSISKTTVKILQAGLYWPTIFKDIRTFAMECDWCQLTGHISMRYEIPLKNILEVEVLVVCGIDSMVPFASSMGNQYILIAVYYMYKQIEAITQSTNNARVMINLFKNNIFRRLDIPRLIISYGGSHFISKQFENLLNKYGVRDKVATPYNPQTCVQVEISNREIKSILDKITSTTRKDWASKLNDALWAYKTYYNTPIRTTPFKLVYGKSCQLLVMLEHKTYQVIKILNMDYSVVKCKRILDLHQLEELRLNAYENALVYKERTKKLHDRSTTIREFNKGKLILLFNYILRLFSGNLFTIWSGPFRVTRVMQSGAMYVWRNREPRIQFHLKVTPPPKGPPEK